MTLLKKDRASKAISEIFSTRRRRPLIILPHRQRGSNGERRQNAHRRKSFLSSTPSSSPSSSPSPSPLSIDLSLLCWWLTTTGTGPLHLTSRTRPSTTGQRRVTVPPSTPRSGSPGSLCHLPQLPVLLLFTQIIRPLRVSSLFHLGFLSIIRFFFFSARLDTPQFVGVLNLGAFIRKGDFCVLFCCCWFGHPKFPIKMLNWNLGCIQLFPYLWTSGCQLFQSVNPFLPVKIICDLYWNPRNL